MTKDEAIDKIKKCLALSASSNEHEAEAALRQARALMEKFGIDDADLLAADASELFAAAGADRHPAAWENMLAHKVADAFGCGLLFQGSHFDPVRWASVSGSWVFIGCGIAPEIAIYAFEVLHRQCKRQRAEHIKTKLKRCKQATKTRRADLFCEGWVYAVGSKLTAFARTEQQAEAIEAFTSKHYPALRSLKTRDRNDGRNLRDHEHADFDSGVRNGNNAELNHGVGQEQMKAIG